MKSEPLLTVIVPVYGAEMYLSKCVDSLLGQTYQNLQILLVDDGSKDSCPEICDQYGKLDPRITVIHQENMGQSMARNHGLELCRGDYVTFADSDDWVEPTAYGEMLEAMERTGADIACCGRYNVEEKTGEKTQGLCPEREEVLSAGEMLKKMLSWQNCDCSPCDKIFKASLFEGIRFPLKSGSEDVAILYKLVLASQKNVLVPIPFYNYLQRSGSTSCGTSVDSRIFRYQKYTEEMYRDICQLAPEAKGAARQMRVWSLAWPLLMAEQAGKSAMDRYSRELAHCRKELRKHISFLLTASCYSLQQRVTYVLLSLGCYRYFRKIFHREN